MPTEGQRRQSRPGLEADLLLLVEGRDEVNLFEKFVQHCLDGDAQTMQVLEVGGKDQFRRRFALIETDARTRPTLRAIGIVRDADDSARNTFRSVRDGIRSVGYEPPGAHGEFSNAELPIGVFIVPDGSRGGAIETLCRESVRAESAANCIDEYLACLRGHAALRSRNEDKTFTHAYLAAQEDPTARVGEGALHGVWDFRSPAFADLSRFIRALASKGT